MARTLADRLGQAWARSFVGRRAELDQFAALLQTPGEPAVVVIHGPAGIGKSTLLRQFEVDAAEQGADCLRIDARDLPPTVEALRSRLAPVLNTDSGRRTVVLVDAYELLADLDTTFREQLAPRLPVDVILVLAGQHPPSVGWRSDEGWSRCCTPCGWAISAPTTAAVTSTVVAYPPTSRLRRSPSRTGTHWRWPWSARWCGRRARWRPRTPPTWYASFWTGCWTRCRARCTALRWRRPPKFG